MTGCAPARVLEAAKAAADRAEFERRPLTLPDLAKALSMHVRTLQAAARTGRLAVNYSARSVFGRALRVSSIAAGKALQRQFYKRYSGQPAGRFMVPTEAPSDASHQIRTLRERLHVSQADLAELIGAANKAVIYQWESGKRVPSSVFWERIVGLARQWR